MINMLDDYTFLNDAYHGTGGFKNGQYLVMHPRETDDKYFRRQEISYYLNYVAPCVNAHVEPVFREPPQTNWKTNQLFSEFFEDVDTAGTDLTSFMKRSALGAKLYGVTFIVVDNAKAEEQPATLEAAIKARKFPYAYTVEASQVEAWATNQAGVLTAIKYTVQSSTGSGLDADNTKKDVWLWTAQEWRVERADGTVETGQHKLGRLPVVPLFAKPFEPNNMKPQSEFYTIARTNKRIFNLCSEIDELARNQAFNLLVIPVGQTQNPADVKDVVVGTENVLIVDGTMSQTAQYIAPDAAPLEQLRKERADLIQEIYRMAALSLVTGVAEQKSGVAKEWDFNTTNQTLADLATNVEKAEKEIAKLFELWTQTTVDFECTYADDFGIVDIAAKLDEVQKAKDLAIGGLFDIECNRRAAAIVFKDLKEDRFDALDKDIEANALDINNAGDSFTPEQMEQIRLYLEQSAAGK